MTSNTNPVTNPQANEEKFKWTIGNIFRSIPQLLIRFITSITVEPMVACYVLPGAIFIAAMENLGLEKTCRVNLGLNDDVCSNMINRSLNNIECSETRGWLQENKTIVSLSEYQNSSDTSTYAVGPKDTNDNLAFFNGTSYLLNLTLAVCDAEVESQKIVALINGYRAPIASIFPIIIILFAGGWSDKKGIIKPCMIVPLVGEFLGCLALLITSIFMYELPMEFGGLLEKILPSITGGTTLMFMGIYKYLSTVIEEKDRTFRFGIFAILVIIFPTVGFSYSGILFEKLGYINIFILGLVLYAAGILYAIFIMKEPKDMKLEEQTTREPTTEDNGATNPAFEGDGNGKMEQLEIDDKGTSSAATEKKSTSRNCCYNFLVEFFNPALAIACIQAIRKPREHRGRFLLILLLIAYFLLIGTAIGESEYYYVYGRLKLNWDATVLGPYLTYLQVIGLVGTGVMIVLFSKLLKLTDPMIGFISTVCSIISRPFFAFALSTAMMYIAASLDLFTTIRAIAIKSIISTIVEENELGRVYSVLGIMDAIGLFVFPPLYAAVYINTLKTFVGAFFLMTMFLFIPAAIIFAIAYFMVKKRKKALDQKNEENKINNDIPVERFSKMDETTYI